jgi:hypothetical protein
MGRKKQYHTEEEKKEANRKDWNLWYEKNKKKHNNNRMIEYYEKQIKDLQEKLSELRK